jgi:endonuclease/exonuclease/phosphatase family metal-dependent hydrolase
MRYLAAVLTALLAVPAWADPIKIATWNLEHLAERNGEGCRPRTDADYETLRRYADRLDADIVAFQEVESASAAARVFDPNKYTIAHCHGNRLERGARAHSLRRCAIPSATSTAHPRSSATR